MQGFLAITAFILGAGLLIAGFIVAPTGQIDSSVLVAAGEALTFCASVLGIDYSYRKKYDNKSNRDS